MFAATFVCSLSILSSCAPCNDCGGGYYDCPPKYPVAVGADDNHYDGTCEIEIIASTRPDTVDSTRVVEVEIYTADEPASQSGTDVPTLVVFLDIWESGFCNFLSMVPEGGYSLKLDGSENHFVCNRRAWEFGSDAELVLRNVGLSPTPEPEMDGAILEGYYTANGGAERYFIRLHSFFADEVVLCSDPGALL